MSSGSEDRVVTGAGVLVWGCGGDGSSATASFGLAKHDFMSHVKWRELQLSLSLSELISRLKDFRERKILEGEIVIQREVRENGEMITGIFW